MVQLTEHTGAARQADQRPFAQLGQRDTGAVGAGEEQVARGDGGDQRIADHRLVGEAGRGLLLGLSEEGDVEFAGPGARPASAPRRPR